MRGLLSPVIVVAALVVAASAGPATSRVALPPPGTIVFGRGDTDADCHGSLWEIGTDGTNARPLVDSGAGECDPDPSPDGTRLAFASRRGGGSSIWVADADGTDPRRVTSGGTDFKPSWSPDGTQLAFERRRGANDYELFVVNADGTGLRAIHGGPDFDGTPDWGPAAGDLLIASAGRKGLGPTATRCDGTALYRLEPDGSRVRRLTRCGWESLMPQWSPDGSAIAWARGVPGSDTFSLAVMNADTTGVRILDPLGEGPGWSPDGRWLVYARDGSLYAIGRDGSGLTRLTAGFQDDAPRWRL